MKIDRYKRDIVLIKILTEDLKQTNKALKSQRQTLREIEKKNLVLRTSEELASCNHVIGYLTGHKVALERSLAWLNCSAEELITMVKEGQEIEEANKKMFRELLKEIKEK